MNRALIGLVVLILFLGQNDVLAQAVAPYSIPPKWYFGLKAGLDFSSGPNYLPGNPLSDSLQENSTTMVDNTGSVLFYSNSNYIVDGSNAILQTINGGNASSGGCIAIPDPADPVNKFYLILANCDPNGGSRHDTTLFTPTKGMYYYKITKIGAGAISISNPLGTLMPGGLAVTDAIGESIAACYDGNGGYWIVSHDGNPSNGTWPPNRYFVWNIKKDGTITGPTTSAGISKASYWKQTIKFNKCQNMIGFVNGNQEYEVYNWDNVNGKLGSLICYSPVSGASLLYGCEFSPDGNMFYISEFTNHRLWQIDLFNTVSPCNQSLAFATSSANTSMNAFGSMQLGPDDKIYVINANKTNSTAKKYIGVISNPNNIATSASKIGYDGKGFSFSSGSKWPNFYRGIVNEAFMPPTLQLQDPSNGCSQFSYNFNQYYGQGITVKANSEEWDFGDGSGWKQGLGSHPSHSYALSNNYTVTLKVKDSVCAQTWTAKKTVAIPCTLPVKLIEFSGKYSNNKVSLNWITTDEINSAYFEILHSVDGVHFNLIGTVLSQNTTFLNSYTYIDYNYQNGTNYYKLEEYSKDGTRTLSDIISITLNSEQIIEVFPNPSNDFFNIHVNGPDQYRIFITDIAGHVLFEEEFSNIAVELEVGREFSKGTYFVKLISDKRTEVIKLLKQ